MAFVLFGYLSAIKEALTGGLILDGANRLIVRHKVSIIQMLPETYKARIERIPGVAAATHQTWFGGIFQDRTSFFMQNPVVPEEFMNMHPEFLLPPSQATAWAQTRTGAIVGRKTADRFNWKIGDKIPLRSTIWRKKDGGFLWEFDIVGIFDSRDKSADTTPFFFHYDYFDEARVWSKGMVGWYTIRVADPSKATEVAKLIDSEFENSIAETKTEPEGAFVQAWIKQVGDIAKISASILGAVFFTILLVTGNTISQSVRERTGELGLLKAIGFTNIQMLALVLSESCLLSLLGGVVGLSLGWLLTGRGDPTGGLLPLFYFPAHDLFFGLIISLALGIVTGLFPALYAMRLRVADSLRRI
jgi:putative ABC transport system permease protein